MDFHFTLSGNHELLDQIEHEFYIFVDHLRTRGAKLESASLTSGHFLGGSKNLLEEKVEVPVEEVPEF
jgi:hypothetical protein